MDDLWSLIQICIKDLDRSVRHLRKSSEEAAEADRAYRIALKQECLRLKSEGLAVGLIDKVAAGSDDVATKKFEKDVKEAVYQANIESINSLKIQIKVLDAQLSREWGRAT